MCILKTFIICQYHHNIECLLTFSFGQLYAGLEIHFDEEVYSTEERDIMGLSGISLSLRDTQVPFRMELIPVTIGVAEAQYDLTDFLSLDEIEDDQEAQSGDM